jgi:hypothetical protein
MAMILRRRGAARKEIPLDEFRQIAERSPDRFDGNKLHHRGHGGRREKESNPEPAWG